MIGYFGTEQAYRLYPLSSDEKKHQLLPAAPNSLYIYENRPPLVQAASGQGALLTLAAAWTETDDGMGKVIDIPAIDDPQPTSPTFERVYFLVINTQTNDTDVSTQAPMIRQLTYRRLRAQEGAIRVFPGDLLHIEPQVKLFCDQLGDIECYIASSIIEIRAMLTGFDTSFGDVLNPDALNTTVAHKALFKFFFAQARSNDSTAGRLADLYAQSFEMLFNQVRLAVDRDRDGTPEGETQPSSGFGSLRFAR